MSTALPRVGVGVLVIEDGRVLLGRRKSAHGAGSWAAPGGHLEFGESIEACAQREVREETGIEICNLRPGPFTNDVFHAEQKHYVTVFMVAKRKSGEPRALEPEKCEAWAWFDWADLPEPLFEPLANLRKLGFVPDDAA